MTATPERLTERLDPVRASANAGLLEEVLSTVRLAGAIFLRGEYREPWALESPPAPVMASVLSPEAKQLILFHIVATGECWLRLESGECLTATAGDVIVLPYGDQHVMGGGEPAVSVAFTDLIDPPPWKEFPVVRLDGGGEQTKVVCGYLHCNDPIFDPIIRALPPLFRVTPPPGPAADWVAASIRYALDASQTPRPKLSRLDMRLPELLFVEVLRLYVEGRPPKLTGWLAALQDDVVGRAMAELHAAPAYRWTMDELATRCACSRSTLNNRFTRLINKSPMQYLNDWRLQLAAKLLRESKEPAASIAYRVGYESEEAFNRAFKRTFGRPPAQWRTSLAAYPT